MLKILVIVPDRWQHGIMSLAGNREHFMIASTEQRPMIGADFLTLGH
jgi:hypothetical protein